jgi:hypothetical protein
MAEQKVCDRCGRRYAQPRIVQARYCPICDGNLVPLDQDPYPDPPITRGKDGVDENGNR